MSTKAAAKVEPTSDDRAEIPPWCNPEASDKARKASLARKRSTRRRRVDPTTCERDYSAEEVEFMRAIEAYKATSNRKFPTWSEVLHVLRSLGYDKGRLPMPAARPAETRHYRAAATA